MSFIKKIARPVVSTTASIALISLLRSSIRCSRNGNSTSRLPSGRICTGYCGLGAADRLRPSGEEDGLFVGGAGADVGEVIVKSSVQTTHSCTIIGATAPLLQLYHSSRVTFHAIHHPRHKRPLAPVRRVAYFPAGNIHIEQ